jgi:hypothetical protein
MKTLLQVTWAVVLILVTCSVLRSQTVTLTFQGGVVVTGSKYTFEVFVQASSPVKMGTANLVFSYSAAGFGSPGAAVLTPSNYSGGNYQPIGLTDYGTGKKSINIELNSDNNGTAIETVYPGTLVGAIEMAIVNGNASAGLVWDVGGSPIYADDNVTLLTTVVGNSDDTNPLPVHVVKMTEGDIPKVFTLYRNYPNPFNPTTTISYRLPAEACVTLRICNVLGQVAKTLVEEDQSPGVYGAQFDASTVGSGVCFYRLRAGDFVQIKKLVLVR